MYISEFLVPLSLFASIVLIIYIIFNTRNRERLAMIEMGVDPSKFQSERKAASISSLKPALFLIGIGMGVLFGYLMHDWFGVPEVVAYTSVIILFGGFGLLLYYFVEGKKLQETNKK